MAAAYFSTADEAVMQEKAKEVSVSAHSPEHNSSRRRQQQELASIPEVETSL